MATLPNSKIYEALGQMGVEKHVGNPYSRADKRQNIQGVDKKEYKCFVNTF